MTPAQREFMEAEFFQLTLSAVTQRGGVYKRGLTEKVRRPVHKTLQEVLDRLLLQYKAEVDEESHFDNIQKLSRGIASKHRTVLNGGFRIGSAQKALNLYLKYRWCLGEIPEPPHCPFDSFVLRRIPSWKSKRWTAIKTIDQYRQLVKDARQVAGKRSLAIWELELYNATVKRQSGVLNE